MVSTTSESFWKGYGTLMGGTFVWGLLCSLGDGRASDWPPYAEWVPAQRSLLEIPLVVAAWMALATIIFVTARLIWKRSIRSNR